MGPNLGRCPAGQRCAFTIGNSILNMKKGAPLAFPVSSADGRDHLPWRDQKSCRAPCVWTSFSSWALRQRPWLSSILRPCPCCTWRPWRRCWRKRPCCSSPQPCPWLQVALLASFEQVCSVLAFFSAGAWVDCAEAVNANRANAPRKRNFFMGCVLIQFQACQTASVNQDTNSFNFPRWQ